MRFGNMWRFFNMRCFGNAATQREMRWFWRFSGLIAFGSVFCSLEATVYSECVTFALRDPGRLVGRRISLVANGANSDDCSEFTEFTN
jgi:hypothetical protein